jgi:hypothetical protein
MPFRVKTGGAIHLVLIAIEQRYIIVGYVGFSLAIIGTALQIISSYIGG